MTSATGPLDLLASSPRPELPVRLSDNAGFALRRAAALRASAAALTSNRNTSHRY
jgi:hypothetical protein